MIFLIYKRDVKAKITRNDVMYNVSKDVYFKIQVSFAFVSYPLIKLSCDSIHLSAYAWKLLFFFFAVTWILCSPKQVNFSMYVSIIVMIYSQSHWWLLNEEETPSDKHSHY